MPGRSPITALGAVPLFSYGFRPFFLLAGIWTMIALPLWLLVWSGQIGLGSPLAGRDWHAHEMIFGYGLPVLTGFLFTAIPNWTGRMPRRGTGLIALALLWIAGRICLLLPAPLAVATLVDIAFPLALLGTVLVEIVAGRNWRNLLVVAPVSAFTLANIAFWWLTCADLATDPALHGGLAALIFLITLIGGRIVPSFTRNWLAKTGHTSLPTSANRFDAVVLIVGAVSLVAWLIAPEATATGGLLIVAGLLHLARMARWRGVAVWSNALLIMLHLSYAVLALGLVALGGSIFRVGLGPDGALHLLAPGAVGSMTLAVMMRASSGHTGHALAAGPWLAGAYGAVISAGLLRGLAGIGELWPLALATLLWSLGFAIFVLRVGPWLIRPNAAKRRPNPAPKPV